MIARVVIQRRVRVGARAPRYGSLRFKRLGRCVNDSVPCNQPDTARHRWSVRNRKRGCNPFYSLRSHHFSALSALNVFHLLGALGLSISRYVRP